MDPTKVLRGELTKLLDGGGAHATFDDAVGNFPENLRGAMPPGAPHSAWELLEHLRIAQWDMLEFSRNPHHESPKWPAGYWPPNPEPGDNRAWLAAIASFRQDAAEMRELVEEADLTAPFPWGKGQTLLREALQLADHNAYHIGELVFLRRLLGSWR